MQIYIHQIISMFFFELLEIWIRIIIKGFTSNIINSCKLHCHETGCVFEIRFCVCRWFMWFPVGLFFVCWCSMSYCRSCQHAFLVAAGPKERIVLLVRNAIVLPSCRLAKGDSVACWHLWLVQPMPMFFQVASWPKVIQKAMRWGFLKGWFELVVVGPCQACKNSGSHVDVSHSQQPLVKGER